MFKSGVIGWGIASVLILVNREIGYIVAAGCIGLLNNLTFVLIMEIFPR